MTMISPFCTMFAAMKQTCKNEIKTYYIDRNTRAKYPIITFFQGVSVLKITFFQYLLLNSVQHKQSCSCFCNLCLYDNALVDFVSTRAFNSKFTANLQ